MSGFNLPAASKVKQYARISRKDPAIDDSAEDFDEFWQRYLQGMEKEVPLKEGMTPVVWTLRQVRGARARAMFKNRAQRGGGSAELFLARYALRSVENLDDVNGNPVELEIVREDGMDLVEMEFMDQLAEVRAAGGPDLIGEIANWAAESLFPS